MLLLAANLCQTDDWLWQALGDRTTILCLGLLFGAALGLLVCGRALYRLPRGRAVEAQPPRPGRDGTATIEFVLVLPIGLFLFLLLTQTALLMGGELFVHYAAFAATRSAIVQIPLDYSAGGPGNGTGGQAGQQQAGGGVGGEPPNVFINADSSTKHENIRQAAVFAVTPVSGQLTNSAFPTDSFTSGLRDLYQSYGRTSPHWIDTLAAGRLRYADANTKVTLLEATIDSNPPYAVTYTELPALAHTFGPKDTITARVTHNFNLSIPYVRMLFATGDHTAATGDDRKYVTISVQYTLTNEGISLDMPPQPPLPRVEPKY